MMQKPRWEKWCSYFGAVAIPLILVVSWQSIDMIYPISDEANYFETAQKIYLKYKSSGFIQGTLAAYAERGWKPIIFPLFAVPFLVISGGNIPVAAEITMVLLFFIFLTYVYLIAKEFLSPWRSFLCTIFLGTIPWVINSAYIFMSEIPLMACSMASLFHLKRSDFLGSLKHSTLAGLWLALGFTINPVIISMSFCILLPAMLYFSWKRQNVGNQDLLITMLIFFLTCLLLIATIFFTVSSKIIFAILWLTILLFFAIPLLFRKKLGLHLPYLTGFVVFNLLFATWWLPGMRGLCSWVYECSLGPMAKLHPGQGKMNLSQTTYSLVSTLGGYPLLGIFCLIILTLLSTRQKSLIRKHVLFLFGALSMIITVLIAISLAKASNYRYAYLSFSFLFLTIFIIAIHPEYILSRLRLFLLTVLSTLQVFVVFANTFDIRFPDLEPVFKNTVRPLREDDPSVRLFQQIKTLPFNQTQIAILRASPFRGMSVDPFTLMLLAIESGSNLSFDYPWKFVDLKDGYLLLESEYNYVIVDFATKNSYSTLLPDRRLAYDITKKWSQWELESVGLSFVSEFHFRNDRTILLLKVNRYAKQT